MSPSDADGARLQLSRASVVAPTPNAAQNPLRLSVVVPTLNEAQSLPRLLGRLTDPERPAADRADEVVISDGGSDDGTVALAEEAAAAAETAETAVRLVSGPAGRGAQLAHGAERAGGDLLLFLHADCVPGPGALADLRAAFEDPRRCATAMSQRIAAPGLFYRLVERAADARSRRGRVMGDSGLAVRREAYRAVGGFRPLPLFEDLDLARRLRGQGQVTLVRHAVLEVSPRRWQREGRLRCTLRNWTLRILFSLGVGPERLCRMYPPHATRAGQH